MRNKEDASQVLLFCIGGGISVSIYYLTLYILTKYIDVWYPISAFFGSILMYSISFYFQKFLTFKNKSKDKIFKEIILYFSMAGVFLAANIILLYVFVEYIHLKLFVAQLILTVLLSIISFFTTKKIFVKQ